MTKVITRFFDSEPRAASVKRALELAGFPRRDLKVFSDKKGLVKALTAAHVVKDTAKAYADRMGSGGAVLLAKATFTPLGAARMARDLTADMGAADMGGLTEEVEVRDPPGRQPLSIFNSHPLILSRTKQADTTDVRMADWPLPLINRRKPLDAFVFPRHARMANFPIPLLSDRKPKDKFIFPRHARMANFPIGLISKRKPFTDSIFQRHARMANFPIPLISQRKPYSGTVIGRHTRMANWPFPLLINGKTGTNALMPGGPRMANFPIDLLSNRKPGDKFAFPRHARMANFPIPLTSQRKPFTGSMFPRHARMADVFLPLVIRNAATDKTKGFSLSNVLRLPTLMRR